MESAGRKPHGPLAGIRIADFTWIAAGPMATRMLAQHGAEVIRIESAKRLDFSRVSPPFAGAKAGSDIVAQYIEAATTRPKSVNLGGMYNFINTCKLSVTLNLALPKAREIARNLVRISDVVTDNFMPGVMQRWELGYHDLVDIKPDIIVASMPAMGNEGRLRDCAGFGPGVEAISGLKALTGPADRPPIGTGMAYTDYSSAPFHTVIAILAALHYRERTGRGQFIEVAQLESAVCFLESAILETTVNERVPERTGNRLSYACPHGAFRCQGQDRWCAIAVFTEAEWQAFRAAIGDPAWAGEDRFATLARRKENEDELDRLIEEWTRPRPAEEVMQAMQTAGVAAGVAQNAEDMLLRDPQLRARGHFVTLVHPEAGPIVHDGVPFKLSATPAELDRPSPLLGQHNDYVFKELLGMSEDEINQCYLDGIIE